MKMNRGFPFSILAGMAPLFAGAGLGAAPLAWFPGPALDPPMSGAATTLVPGLGNVLIGGDGFASYSFQATYPLSLAATNNSWNRLPPLYSLNIAPGAVASGGIIIVYGGTDGTNATNAVLGYSPSGDPVLTLTPMSVARAYLGYAADTGGNAYALGGLDAGGHPLASAERYNPDADAWSAIASLPAPRYNFPAVSDGTNEIYVFGGSTNTQTGSETADVLRYSVSGNQWTAMAPMPVATAGSAAAWGVDGKVYVVGGVAGGATLNSVQVYNPTVNAWTLLTPLPKNLSASAMGVDGLGRLVLMGGMDANGTDVADVWRSQLLGAPDTPPVLVSYPASFASYQVPYSSSLSATGNPQPVYLLLGGPPGMKVDFYSGAITWTPQADGIGANPVRIEATNFAGAVEWDFTITVPNPPPAAVTNLAVTAVTDNSVTLSWDPESSVSGPVSYSVWLRHFLHDPKGSGGSVWYTPIGNATTAPTVTISGLTPGLSQAYYVVATGPGGSSGTNSAIVATPSSPPGPPTLAVTALTSTAVSLAWDPAPGPAQNPLFSPITSYTIMERDLSTVPASNIPTVSNIQANAGTVTGLTPNRSHIWFVSGVDAQGYASPLTWVYVTVTNPTPMAPLLTRAAPQPDGSFRFTGQETGPIVQTMLIEANVDLLNPAGWVQLGSFLPSSSTFTFTDTNAAQYPKRFYRAVAP